MKRSVLYDLYGLDFMLDDQMNLWFIEGNTAPALSGTSAAKEKLMTTMLVDMLEI
jgi:D-alanine-D-alanine ligase-like ATP-grasp enzyme